jgi:hypothetical protein
MTVTAFRRARAAAGLAAASVLVLGLLAPLARAASDNLDVTAQVITPLSLSKTSGLSFGKFSTSGAASTIVVSTSNVATPGTGIDLSGDVTSGAYDVQGEPSTAYTITVPSSINLTDGDSHTMTVDTFVTSKTDNTSTLSGAGTDSFAIGATLNVGASQAAGSYTGTATISVDYN